jgi:hypothetical protein
MRRDAGTGSSGADPSLWPRAWSTPLAPSRTPAPHDSRSASSFSAGSGAGRRRAVPGCVSAVVRGRVKGRDSWPGLPNPVEPAGSSSRRRVDHPTPSHALVLWTQSKYILIPQIVKLPCSWICVWVDKAGCGPANVILCISSPSRRG